MKYDLQQMLREIKADEKRRKPDPPRKLTQQQIRELVSKRKKTRP